MRNLFVAITVIVMLSLVYSHKYPVFKGAGSGSEIKETDTVMPENLLEQDYFPIAPGDSDAGDIQEQAKIKIMMTPIAEKLTFAEVSDVKRWFLQLISRMKASDNLIKTYFFIAAGIILFLMFLTGKTTFSGYSLLFAKLGFGLGRILIFITALSAVIGSLVFKYNFYVHINGIFFAGPLALLVTSAAALKIYDFNAPVRNRMIFSFIFPVCSAAVIHVF